jgi:hypothetical protein
VGRPPRPRRYDTADAARERPAQLHYNRRFTGDENVRWFETIHKYGDFKRGLILGAAGMMRETYILEHNPSLHLTFMDISPGAVEKRKAQLAPMTQSDDHTRRLFLPGRLRRRAEVGAIA